MFGHLPKEAVEKFFSERFQCHHSDHTAHQDHESASVSVSHISPIITILIASLWIGFLLWSSTTAWLAI